MTEFWLIRHGQTDWNSTGRWQGQSPDAPALNDAGFAQALALRDQLPDADFSAIYSSDLLRAKQTAELVAAPLNLTVVLDSRLREMNLGAWEGMLSDDIQAQYPRELEARKQNPFEARAPQGESPREVAQRVIAAADEIAARHPNQSVLIVSHGVSLAIILCRAREIPLDKVYENIPENAKPYRAKWK
ncbi:MAG: histidine phosphatase family protein [Anaerolineales bacterium]|nr:histidine phosphatase family protein [Anaerolineales bacterium]